MRRRIASIDHPALTASAAEPRPTAARRRPRRELVEGVRTDRERIAVLLQAAALTSHLERAAWELTTEWSEGWLNRRGLLRGMAARPRSGVPNRLPFCQVPLRDLLRLLFRTSAGVAGRGEGRVAARRLLTLWDQELAPISADEAVGQLLTAAGFLWQVAFDEPRRALAARVRLGDDREEVWVAGPGWVRRRSEAGRRETGAEGRCLDGPTGDGPTEDGAGLQRQAEVVREISTCEWAAPAPDPPLGRLVNPWAGQPSRGRYWQRAARAARAVRAVRLGVEPTPEDETEALRAAHDLHAVGQFRAALALLEPVRSVPAEALRVVSLCHLGDLGAAATRLRALAVDRLPWSIRIELGEVALRLLADRGQADRGPRWLRDSVGAPAPGRALVPASACAVDAEWVRVAVGLLWVESAADRGRLERMKQGLAATGKARRFPSLGWRWYRLRGLLHRAHGDRRAALRSLERALASERRSQRPIDAAGLWHETAICRSAVGDLVGAERACLHGVHLLRAAEGARLRSQILVRLADIGLRRGRTEGAEKALRHAARSERESGDQRGAARTAAVWARLELARGEPGAALSRLAGAATVGAPGVDDACRVLAARALGWLGRPAEARSQLGETDALGLVDDEELPALHGLAGDPGGAVAVAAGPTAALWRAALSGSEIAAGDWSVLERLPDHRAARLVFDAERLHPGVVPGWALLRSASTLRERGARDFARDLEVAAGGVWPAISRYLESARDPTRPHAKALTDLCRDSGSDRVRIVGRDTDGERVYVPGRGGASLRTLRAGNECLELRADRIGSRERVILELAAMGRRHRDPSRKEPGERGWRDPRINASDRGQIVGDSPGLRRALERVDRLALSDLPILIEGDTGTGKELVARRVHSRSSRRREPFLPVNCAALSETLLLSELFGHARGAFTGADRERVGVFEAARSGTVFLDEIGDLPVAAQGALLRVLQEKEVRRLGENRARAVAARIVAATHRDLETRSRRDDFRADLYFRLRVAHVRLPPLRERGADLGLLAAHFLGAHGLDLDDAVRSRLRAHTWPGNVRELRNVLEAAVALLEPGEPLTAAKLDLPEPTGDGDIDSYHQRVEDYRRRLLRDAITACDGNRSRAAVQLGLSRQAISYLVRRLGIAP